MIPIVSILCADTAIAAAQDQLVLRLQLQKLTWQTLSDAFPHQLPSTLRLTGVILVPGQEYEPIRDITRPAEKAAGFTVIVDTRLPN